MREIKFRVWDHEEGQFETGFWMYQDGSVDHDYKNLNRDYTIQEYTGLKDKNGVEIYEGDILFCENLIDDDDDDELSKLKITWCDISLCWRGMSKTDDGYFAMDMMLCEVDEEGLVVGNIFEGVDK